MPLSIYSNLASTGAQLRLGKAQDMVGKSMAQLSSGLRIATIADDPSGMGIAVQFDTQVRSYNQAARNTNDGVSLLQTMDGAMGQIHGVLQRMRELAMQSSNGTLTDAVERTNLQTEFSQLQSEIDRISNSTSFGNVTLLNGATTTLSIQVGVTNTSSDSISLSIPQTDTTKLGVGAISVSKQTSAASALTTLDTAISSISNSRATLGATQNRLRVALDNDNAFSASLSAAVSRIRDVDVASASADLARNQVLTQAGIAVLAQANQAPNLALSLLRG